VAVAPPGKILLNFLEAKLLLQAYITDEVGKDEGTPENTADKEGNPYEG